MRPDGAAKRLERLCRLLDLDISPHDLRHYAVTEALAAGASIADVARMVGDNAKTVMGTYAHHISADMAHLPALIRRRMTREGD
jgi:integrase